MVENVVEFGMDEGRQRLVSRNVERDGQLDLLSVLGLERVAVENGDKGIAFGVVAVALKHKRGD